MFAPGTPAQGRAVARAAYVGPILRPFSPPLAAGRCGRDATFARKALTLMTTQTTKSRARQLLASAVTAARPGRERDRGVPANQRDRGMSANQDVRPGRHGAPDAGPILVLDHATALAENGFTVFRGLFSPTECAELTQALKAQARITDSVKFTKIDATNAFETARELLLEGRILDAVRESIGADARFLQVSDLHYLHDTAAWHRDSVHRAADASDAPDWSDPGTAYKVVKAILYLEAENSAMGIMAGSHRSATEMDHATVKRIEAAGEQIVIDAGAEPNRKLTEAQKRTPLAWQAQVGDVLVFDERMYHAGRRVENGRVTANREAPKFTLSLVFGADNHHSERMYSYFRFARKELPYRDLPPALRAVLAERGLVPSQGWSNFYRRHPQELRHVHLRDQSELGPLIAEFSRPER